MNDRDNLENVRERACTLTDLDLDDLMADGHNPCEEAGSCDKCQHCGVVYAEH